MVLLRSLAISFSVLMFSSSNALSLNSDDASAISTDTNIDSETKQLERVVVTAQRRTQDNQDVPISITVLSGESLLEQSLNTVFDLQNRIVGFSATQSQSSNNSAFSIRGIGTSSQNYGFESSVGIYVDGVYRPRSNTFINNLIDVSSIEVLRGPQGTLFGKNTSAGAVLLNTHAPEHGIANGYTQINVGNLGLISLQGAGNATAIEDVLSFRVSGFYEDRDGFVDNLSKQGGDTNSGIHSSINDRHRYGSKIQALFTPTDVLRIRAIADYARFDESCCAALTYQDNFAANQVPERFGTDAVISAPPFNATLYTREDFDSLTTSLSFLPTSALEETGLSVQADWQYSERLSFNSITAHRQYVSEDVIDSDFSDAELLRTTNDVTQSAFSQEFQLKYQTDLVNVIAGVFFFKQDLDLDFTLGTDSQFDEFVAGSLQPLQPIIDGINQLSAITSGFIAPASSPTIEELRFFHQADQNHKSWALFSQAEWRLTENTTIISGLRYTKEEKNISAEYFELAEDFNGLVSQAELLPNPIAAGQALGDIATALQNGGQPSAENLSAIAGFQQAGWGYFFLQTAAARPRAPLNDSLSDDQLTGTFKVLYQPRDNMLYYASYGTGYKSGGINTDRIAPQFSAVFNAETSESYEFGVKLDLFNNTMRINAATHLTNIRDFQASTFTGTGFNLQNAGDIESKGFEIDLIWQAMSNLEFRAGYSRTIATFESFDRGTCWVSTPFHTGIDDPGRVEGAPFCSRSGDRVGFEPENMAFLSSEYDFDVFNLPSSLGITISYTGDMFLDDSNDPIKFSNSFSLMDAFYTVNLPKLDTDISLWAQNVLDTRYAARNGFDAPVQTGKVFAYPGQPRTFGVSVTARF